MTDKLRHNASESTKAIVYQFYVALEKCFELEEDESVFIEYYGDVSIGGKTQIEVKNYKNSLSNLDHNFWKTLRNWLVDDFPRKKFRSFILCTTQEIGSRSNFKAWNQSDRNTKLQILKGINDNYQKKKKKDKDTLELLSYVMDDVRRKNLNYILDKFIIQSSQKNYQAYHKSIRDIYAKPIPHSSRDRFINSLLGYITSPKLSVDNNWEISYETFSKEVEELTKVLKEDSVIFPQKLKLRDIDNTKYLDSLFVKKIEEIKYHEVIADAISDYVNTNNIAINDFRNGSRFEQLQEYKEDIHGSYKLKYGKAKRNANKDEIINCSKDFYDIFLSENPSSFSTFTSVPHYFRRGVIHNMANSDENYNIKWNLNDE